MSWMREKKVWISNLHCRYCTWNSRKRKIIWFHHDGKVDWWQRWSCRLCSPSKYRQILVIHAFPFACSSNTLCLTVQYAKLLYIHYRSNWFMNTFPILITLFSLSIFWIFIYILVGPWIYNHCTCNWIQ